MKNPKLKIQNLRKQYPKFAYKRYAYKISGNNLEIVFYFALHNLKKKEDHSIIFQPKIVIKNIDKKRLEEVGEGVLNNLIFHLGLIEIPSYWKAACSPTIEIEAGYLDKEQLRWWKDLFIRGMGQFYYENKIDWRGQNFLKIYSLQGSDPCKRYSQALKNRYLVPFAGGRDSIVTLETLKKRFANWQEKFALFSANPNKIIMHAGAASGVKNHIIVRRLIDKKLLRLNDQGFLNGHTPFTSLLSFLSVFCAVLFDYKNIAFSLEKSANEGNVKYLGKTINHQWAKSREFEKKFKNYCKKYLAKNANYFSLLRNNTELEISKKFTKYPQYFPLFSSCNMAMKIKSASSARWCQNCPKCLFVYMSLYPFLKKVEITRIFGKDIFENKKLLPTLKDLLGQGRVKPFECVGTKKESRMAFKLSKEKAQKLGKIPYLLTKMK